MSHVSPDFIPVFGDCLRMTRQVLYTTTAQPFLISGSGTLGWDQVRPLSLPLPLKDPQIERIARAAGLGQPRRAR